jgi:hypothetical protein
MARRRYVGYRPVYCHRCGADYAWDGGSGRWVCGTVYCSNWFYAARGRMEQDEAFPLLEVRMAKFILKRPEAGATPGEVPAAQENCMFSTLPALWEYLTCDTWPDGKRRQTSTLSIFVEDGKVKASLNDRAMQRGLYATGSSLGDALLCLEHAIATDRADWRAWPRKK